MIYHCKERHEPIETPEVPEDFVCPDTTEMIYQTLSIPKLKNQKKKIGWRGGPEKGETINGKYTLTITRRKIVKEEEKD